MQIIGYIDVVDSKDEVQIVNDDSGLEAYQAANLEAVSKRSDTLSVYSLRAKQERVWKQVSEWQ